MARKTETAKAVADEPRPFRFCAHMGCGTEALIAQKTPTGWANLCYPHYLDYHTAEARKSNEANGIYTTEQCRANCLRLAGVLVKRLKTLPAEREPGQDDEERAA